MKSFLGEYGKIIILTFALIGILAFVFGNGDEQLIGMLRKAEPKATVEHQDNSGIVGNITSRELPILTIEKRTFLAGRTYNLLDGTEARNADGQYLPVQIEKIVNPENEEITEMVDIQNFVPKCGAYQITYSAEETYMTVKKKTEKTIVFVAD